MSACNENPTWLFHGCAVTSMGCHDTTVMSLFVMLLDRSGGGSRAQSVDRDPSTPRVLFCLVFGKSVH